MQELKVLGVGLAGKTGPQLAQRLPKAMFTYTSEHTRTHARTHTFRQGNAGLITAKWSGVWPSLFAISKSASTAASAAAADALPCSAASITGVHPSEAWKFGLAPALSSNLTRPGNPSAAAE